MKKLFLFLVFFMLFSCVKDYKNDCNLCENIDFENLENKFKNNCTFVAILKDNACNLCQKYNFVLDNYLSEHDIIIYSLDASSLDLSDKSISLFINEVKVKAGVNDNAILPSTLFYLEGILINVEIGVLSEKELANNIDLLFSIQ